MSFSGSYSTVLPSVRSLGHIVGQPGCMTSTFGTLALYNAIFTHKHNLHSSTFLSYMELYRTQVVLKPVCYQNTEMTYKYNIKLGIMNNNLMI